MLEMQSEEMYSSTNDSNLNLEPVTRTMLKHDYGNRLGFTYYNLGMR
jgi:hypothetical protein